MTGNTTIMFSNVLLKDLSHIFAENELLSVSIKHQDGMIHNSAV